MSAQIAEEIPPVETATLVPGARRLDANQSGVNETYIGLLETAAGRRKAYIKILEGRQLVNELAGATLGRALKLRVPTPYLVRLLSSDLPDSEILKGQTGELLAFGSATMRHPTLERRVELKDAAVASWVEREVGASGDVVVFDDWIANADRHFKNVLVDGKGLSWLIDHSHGFTGVNWVVNDLVPERDDLPNEFAKLFFQSMSANDRANCRNRALGRMDMYRAINVKSASVACHIPKLLDDQSYGQLCKFIEERVQHLIRILCNRLGIPMIGGMHV